MITFITLVLIILSLFVDANWSIVLVAIPILLNIGKLYNGFKGRKSDPIEWGKTLLVNGGATVLLVGLLIWAFLP